MFFFFKNLEMIMACGKQIKYGALEVIDMRIILFHPHDKKTYN